MKEIWAELAERYPFLLTLMVKAKTFTLPGFDGIPVFEVYQFFIAEIRANSLPTRSKSIAFSFFLAIFPALTFVFSLIPYIPYFSDMDDKIMEFLRQVLPNKETYAFMKSFIQPLLKDLAKHKRGGLLTGSIFMVVFLTSNGVMAMMSSFDKSYDHYKKRNAIHSRLVALQITVLLVILFIFSLGLVILGQDILAYIFDVLKIKSAFTHLLLNFLRYALILLMFFLGISLIYYYGPDRKSVV